VQAPTERADGVVVLLRGHLRGTQAKVRLGLEGLGLVEGPVRFVGALSREFLARQNHSLFRGEGFELVQRQVGLRYRTFRVVDFLMRRKSGVVGKVRERGADDGETTILTK
jgi:hypothetical protein